MAEIAASEKTEQEVQRQRYVYASLKYDPNCKQGELPSHIMAFCYRRQSPCCSDFGT